MGCACIVRKTHFNKNNEKEEKENENENEIENVIREEYNDLKDNNEYKANQKNSRASKELKEIKSYEHYMLIPRNKFLYAKITIIWFIPENMMDLHFENYSAIRLVISISLKFISISVIFSFLI